MQRTLILIVCIGFSPSLALARDEIRRTGPDGKPETVIGDIKDEKPTDVIIATLKGEITIPVTEIISVKYDRQPPELVNVRSKIDQGRYEEAIEDLKRIGSTVQDQEFLQAAIAFAIYRAAAELAIADSSKTEEALQWHSRFIKGFPVSRHHYPMQELLGRVHLARGDFAEAAKALATLREVKWPGYQEKAAVYEGLAALKQGRAAEALKAFDQVIESQNDSPETVQQKHRAKVFKGQVLVQMDKPADARKLLDEALKEIPSSAHEVKAMGYNALGDALRKTGDDKIAMLDGYMKVYILYNKDGGELAKALFNLSQIFTKLGQADRASAMAEQLRSQFPNSEWTKRLASPGSS